MKAAIMLGLSVAVLPSITLLFVISGTAAVLTATDEAEFLKIPWLDWRQALNAYREEHRISELLGKVTKENPNGLKFYPENRVLANRTVVLFCLLTPDRVNGYRTNSISLQILQEGHTHRRSLLAPTRMLLSHADQLNCWNYAQESVCQPLRDCSNPSNPGLFTVGIITKEGWGVFQLTAGRITQAHYQCISELQSVLTSEERTERKLKEYDSIGSDVEQLQVFDSDIGEPRLHLRPANPRGQPLTAQCKVANSRPGSQFAIDLVLLRPPPPGTPGANRHELLASQSTLAAETEGLLDWTGELALLSHHGLGIQCVVSSDWGDRKGQRVASGHLRVTYLFPVFLTNPRIIHEMKSIRMRSTKHNYYTPGSISLKKAEYVACKADGFPKPTIEWSSSGDSESVWILNETLFVSNKAKTAQTIKARCVVSNNDLNLTDSFDVSIKVMASANALNSSVSALMLLMSHLMLHAICRLLA